MSRFYKVYLILIVLLLAVIAFRPFVNPQPAIAAGHYQYIAVNTSQWSSDIERELNKRVAEGWELAAPVVSEQTPGVILIFRKEAR